jgi:nucleoid DNA-binding protein
MNKQQTVRGIAQKTGLTYAQAEVAVEALIEIWGDELAAGGKIAIEHFLSLEYKAVERENTGQLHCYDGQTVIPPKVQYRLSATPSSELRMRRRGNYSYHKHIRENGLIR